MILENQKMLALFRGVGSCGYCNQACQNREAAHIFSRGAGWVDFRCNIIALGGPGDCACHVMNHGGHEPTRADLLAASAKRWKTQPTCIEDCVYLMRRLPRRPTQYQVIDGINSLSTMSAWLFTQEWNEAVQMGALDYEEITVSHEDSPTLEIEVDAVVAETPNAFLFRIKDREEWVPKSQIVDHESIEHGDENIEVTISEWIAEKKDLP